MTFRYRCNPKSISQLNLTQDQKQFVDEIGFGSLHNLRPCDLPFEITFWLVENFDYESKTLILGDKKIPIKPLVHKVLGIPEGSLEIDLTEEKYSPKLKALYTKGNEAKKYDDVAKRLKKLTTQEVKDEFCRSYMLCVLGCYLAPNTTLKVNRSFLTVLQDVSRIKEYKWCTFVAEYLIFGIKEFRTSPTNYACGCLHILHIIYFDFLHKPTHPMQTPRIHYVTEEDLKDLMPLNLSLEVLNFSDTIYAEELSQCHEIPLNTEEETDAHAHTILEKFMKEKNSELDELVQEHELVHKKISEVQKASEDHLLKLKKFRVSFRTQLYNVVQRVSKNRRSMNRDKSDDRSAGASGTPFSLGDDVDDRSMGANDGNTQGTSIPEDSSPTKFKADEDVVEMYKKYIIEREKLRITGDFVTIGGFGVTYSEFCDSFCPRGKISNIVMSAYLELFNLENDSKFSFNSYFTELLKKDDLTYAKNRFQKLYETNNLRHRKIKLLMLPILDDGHWVLVCINFLLNQINFFDSFGGSCDKVAQIVITNFSTFWEEIEPKRLQEFGKPIDISAPLQPNLFDCGLYTMIYMEKWDGKTLQSFAVDTVDQFRMLIVNRLITSHHNVAQSKQESLKEPDTNVDTPSTEPEIGTPQSKPGMERTIEEQKEPTSSNSFANVEKQEEELWMTPQHDKIYELLKGKCQKKFKAQKDARANEDCSSPTKFKAEKDVIQGQPTNGRNETDEQDHQGQNETDEQDHPGQNETDEQDHPGQNESEGRPTDGQCSPISFALPSAPLPTDGQNESDEQDHPGQNETEDWPTDGQSFMYHQKRKRVNEDCSSQKKFKAQKDARANEDCSSPTKFKAEKDVIEIYRKNKKFVTIGGFHITYREFLHSFRPKGEISDIAMSVYVELFNLENEQDGQKSCSKFSFNYHFTEKLKKGDLVGAWKILKKADAKHNLKDKNLLLLPIMDNGHWVLVCINFLFNQINFFDSIRGAHGLATNQVAERVIENFSTLWEKTEGKCVKGFEKHTNSYPLQLKMYDCGLYTMIYMERWDGKILKSFMPDTVDHFRKLIVYRLIMSAHNLADPSFIGNSMNVINRKCRSSFIHFEEHEFLSAQVRDEIYQLLNRNYNDHPVLNMDGTTMMGGELVKCLEEVDNALSIMNAFVQCLKYDDQAKGYNKIRIIIPPQNLIGEGVSGEGVSQVIAIELADEEPQRFVACPILHHEEWYVFFVNIETNYHITIFHPSDSKLSTKEMASYGKTFGEQVKKAFRQSGYVLPDYNMPQISVSTHCFFTKSKESLLESILVLEKYNGHDVPQMKTQHMFHTYKVQKLVRLLVHEKNTAQLPSEIDKLLQKGLDKLLEPEIKRWSIGKQGDLRVLLSTLHQIIPVQSTWEPFTDLSSAGAMKKAYKIVALCIHPDKVQQKGATIRNKFICEKVFILLKDAWEKFSQS